MTLRSVIILVIIAAAFIVAMVSAATDVQTLTAETCPPGTPVIIVNPGDAIPYGTCADLFVVAWSGKLVHVSGTPIIDISSFTKKIWIRPGIWKLGRYDQWSKIEEPRGNLFAFEVVEQSTNLKPVATVTTPASIKSVTITAEYNLPEKNISDILIARGDPLSFNNPGITSLTRVWLFGINDRLYDIPCKNGQLFVNASTTQSLSSGTYYLMLDNPGANTKIEATWNEEKNQVESPFRATPYLEVPGYDPRTVYDKIVPWLKTYSDDQITIYKLEIQEPYLEIVGIGTTYYERKDTLQVDGYTNLAIGNTIYAVVDEDNETMNILKIPRTYATVSGNSNKPGTMREFHVYPPFKYEDMAPVQHSITVHGPLDTYATVGVPVGSMPAGQVPPQEYIHYINSTLWNPTPTPEKIFIKEPVPGPTRIVIQTITPSEEQIYTQQKKINEENIGTWIPRIIVGVIIVVGIWYVVSLYLRRREMN